MSQVRAAEKIQFDKAAIQELDGDSSQGTKEFSPPSGLALHQVFNQDILNELLAQSVEVETFTPSFWQRIVAWFKGTDKEDLTSQKSESKTIADSKETKPDAISPVPVLDPPETNLEDLLSTKLPPVSKKRDLKTKLTSSDIEEALSLMSGHTIDTIMFIIFKTQIQLEKENAMTAESTFSKYLDFQKVQQQVLGEIKDALVNDEMIAKRFGTAQNIALLASFMAGIAGVAVTFGLLGPVWGFLSTASAAGLTVTTLGGKAYFQRILNEHKAQHEDYSHHDQYYGGRVDDSRNRLMATAEADTIFKERWIQFLRRSDKMRKLVFKK